MSELRKKKLIIKLNDVKLEEDNDQQLEQLPKLQHPVDLRNKHQRSPLAHLGESVLIYPPRVI